MTLILQGTDNSVSSPAVQGGTAGATTGVYYPTTNQVALGANGTLALVAIGSQQVGIGAVPSSQWTGQDLFQVSSSSIYATLSLATTRTYTTGNRIGSIVFDMPNNTSSYRTRAEIEGSMIGTTANKFGGQVRINIAGDNVTDGAMTNSATFNQYGIGLNTTPSSGTGIAFPASQNASSDANTLDDYEEGTWTPTLTGTSGVASYTTQSGSYVKIGNTVYCNFFIQFAKNTLSGNITLGGLPFQVGSAAYNACVPAANWYFPSGGPAIVNFLMRTGTNTSTATFYYLTSGNLDATANILTDAQIGSTSSQQITCMFYYNV